MTSQNLFKELTKSGKELHLLHVKSLKEKLSGYGIDTFTLSYPIKLSDGEKINKNVCNDMCQVEILGKEKLNEFIQERLIDGKVEFFNPIKKNSQKIKLFQLSKRIAKHLDSLLTIKTHLEDIAVYFMPGTAKSSFLSSRT